MASDCWCGKVHSVGPCPGRLAHKRLSSPLALLQNHRHTSFSLLSESAKSPQSQSRTLLSLSRLFQFDERVMGKRKRKQVAAPADRDSKRPRVDDEASSSTSAPLGNGEGLHGSAEDVTLDRHSVLQEEPPPPPPPQVSTQSIEAQGESPTGGWKWNFNLEEESPDGSLTLPNVPADWLILPSLPSEEVGAIMPEAMFIAMVRCFVEHRMVG